MRSSEHSSASLAMLDLESGVPTSPADAAALQRLRDEACDPEAAWAWSASVSVLFPVLPRRTTSKGWEPFSLEEEA